MRRVLSTFQDVGRVTIVRYWEPVGYRVLLLSSGCGMVFSASALDGHAMSTAVLHASCIIMTHENVRLDGNTSMMIALLLREAPNRVRIP